jgi:hypothetical protein
MNAATLLIVGASGDPIYELALGPAASDDTSHLSQFVLHAALDMVERQRALDAGATVAPGADGRDSGTPNEKPNFLRTVDVFNEQRVSAYVTGGGTATLMLLHEGRIVPDEQLRAFFNELSSLYVRLLLNPLYTRGAPITSRQFDLRARALSKSYLALGR